MMMRTTSILVTGAALLHVACSPAGEAASAEPPKAATSGQSTTEPGAPNIAWAEKNRDQRLEWMGLEVLPAMETAFQQFDAEGFGDFKCQTCHGDNMQEVDFKMPNDLYALPRENTFQSAAEYDAEIAKFMSEVVVPKMAALLGTEPLNAETGKGFGCFGCHPSE